jgi:hypothetical protein
MFAEQRCRIAFGDRQTAHGSNMPIIGYFDGAAGRAGSGKRATTWPPSRPARRARPPHVHVQSRPPTLFVEAMNLLGRSNYGQSDGSVRANLQAINFVERLIPFVPSAGFLIEF